MLALLAARAVPARLAFAAFVLSAIELAAAQYRVDQGRPLDANTAVGGTRFNDIVPYQPLLGGNLTAAGNIRGGLALRSFSPIGDPTGFRASLGSGSLSSFLRDSVSVADRGSPLFTPASIAGRTFFDPAVTAPTAAYLTGTGRYAFSGVPRGAYSDGTAALPVQPLPGLLNYAGPIDARIQPSPVDFSVRPEPVRPSPLSSSLFGVRPALPDWQRDPSLPGNPQDPRRVPGAPADPQQLQQQPQLDPFRPSTPTQPEPTARLDYRQTPKPIADPLDLLLRGDSTQMLTRRQPETDPARLARVPESDQTPRADQSAAARSEALRQQPAEPPTAVSASLNPGSDVFTDMQLAIALRANPDAEWFKDMLAAQSGATRQSQPLSPPPPGTAQAAALESQAFLARVLEAPLRTFVGQAATPLNDELLKAESMLAIGQYYDASQRYAYAQMIDPGNPLPLIGRGHALLAAGDYRSAATFLVRGLERFPELTRFQVDLREFLGKGEIIDIRRADLMRAIERTDDASVRFLLGYLEYHTGDKQGGLEDLDRAAASAPPGSLIRRYPDMLRGKSVLPPPKLPGEPSVPAAPAEPSEDRE